MPAVLLCAQFTDKELTLRKQTRAGARRTLPNPAATARALALATCEVEAGLRSASQLERICHPSLWDAVANRIQRAGGPPVSVASVLRSRSRSSRRAWSMPWTRAWPWCPSLPCTAPRSPGARSSRRGAGRGSPAPTKHAWCPPGGAGARAGRLAGRPGPDPLPGRRLTGNASVHPIVYGSTEPHGLGKRWLARRLAVDL